MKPKEAKKTINTFEELLWDSANKLRGTVESSEYKHVVLSLIFLKFASDKFEERRKQLVDEGKSSHIDNVVFYTMSNVFYLSEESRWSFIQANAKQDGLALKIDTALHTIEKNNKSLAGALPDNYFSRLGLDRSKLAALIDTISKINTISENSTDIVGRVYEYFLSKFALAEGKGKGEFYTPKSIVNLIAELLEPYKGKIYDPCCGSGGMFVQSIKFIESHQGDKKEVSIYGQEGTSTTLKLAKMNLAIRGIPANFGERADDTFFRDQHPDLEADFIMANPPFNQNSWRATDELTDDPRWEGYEVPPTQNANYAWILHIVSKLSKDGMAGFILANGALAAQGTEKTIRKGLIDNDLIEAIIVLPMDMFYTTDISVSLWVLNKNKNARQVKRTVGDVSLRDRRGEVLFIDARPFGYVQDKKFINFDVDDDIKKIAQIFHSWQQHSPVETYRDVEELCYAAKKDEISKKDYSLVPSKYIHFKHDVAFSQKEHDVDEIEKELLSMLEKDSQSNDQLLAVLRPQEAIDEN
jgi:type I restriction enzyme M protein